MSLVLHFSDIFLAVVIGANVLVVLGAAVQAIAKGNEQMWVILIGRLLLGFGGGEMMCASSLFKECCISRHRPTYVPSLSNLKR